MIGGCRHRREVVEVEEGRGDELIGRPCMLDAISMMGTTPFAYVLVVRAPLN